VNCVDDKGRSPDVEKALAAEILAEGRRKAALAVSQAEASARQTMEKAVQEARTQADRVLGEASRTIDHARAVSHSSLRLEERMNRIKLEGRLIEEVFAAADAQLAGGKGKTGTSVLGLAVEAVLAMAGDAFVVRMAQADLASLKDAFPASLAEEVRNKSGREIHVTVADEPTPQAGGVIVETTDGRERVDNTFAARLARMKEEVRFDVAKLLFTEEEEAE
jgi:V/A-type H+/Na+-transporting ATPase subunit E